MKHEDPDWVAPWRCPWTGKQDFTFAPDFSGIDPDTRKPRSPEDRQDLGFRGKLSGHGQGGLQKGSSRKS